MSKTYVIDHKKDTRIPFLRGMLTRSLQIAGLEFVDAYKVATDIREDLEDIDLITTNDLRNRIVEILEEEHPGAILKRYQKEGLYRESVLVNYGNGNITPFSRGILSQRLEICGLSADKSSSLTRLIQRRLNRDKTREISSKELTKVVYKCLLDEIGPEIADRFLIWGDFARHNHPLILMFGGIPGSGKSTIATEVANRLEIIRTQSTDMLREVMRILIPERLSPVLHTSSFNAGKALKPTSYLDMDDEEILLSGFQRQAEMVEVACEAVLNRAVNERVSIILEGVHVRPTLLQRIPESDAVIVPITLAVLDKKKLIGHFKGRSIEVTQRRAERYLNNLDEIWSLQSVLLSEADAADIAILNNENKEETIKEVINVILETITVKYKDKIQALREKVNEM